MKVTFGVVAAANLLGAAQASKALTQALAQMGVSTGVSMDLCGSSSQSQGSSVVSYCVQGSQTVANNVQWTPCCTFEDVPPTEEVCRSFTTTGAYCTDDIDTCRTALTTAQAEMTFDISWQANSVQECCKTCVCFGDPECISFDGTQNLWIPCDARVKNSNGWCPMWKDQCLGATSDANSNVGGCQWIGGSITTTQGNSGWDIATQGSPCVPVDPVADVSMNMYTKGSFSADLYLGERGVIKQMKLTMGSTTATLDADACFSNPDLSAWTFTPSQPSSMPTGWAVTTPSGASNTWETVNWQAVDSTEQVVIDLTCARSIGSDGTPGGARININGLTTTTDSTGSGFCATGNIPEAGDNEAQKTMHAQCTQDRRTDTLQACKHLVAMGATSAEMTECAQQFCNTADLTDSQRTSCRSSLVSGQSSWTTWRDWYCTAVAATGTCTKTECQNAVNNNGWNKATQQCGRGLPTDAASSVTCSTDLSSYAVSSTNSEDECRNGATLQSKNPTTGEWEDEYFFPAYCQALSFTIPFSTSTEDLFTREIRLIQCEPQTKEACRALGTCESTPGATFTIEYQNIVGKASSVLENGGYLCSPKNDGSGGYICENGSGSNKDLCPCENCNSLVEDRVKTLLVSN